MNRILVAATAALLATTADAQDRGPVTKNSSPPLIVVEDKGGTSALPYYRALNPQDAQPGQPATPQTKPRIGGPAEAEAAMLPVRSMRLTPGDEPRRVIRAPGLTPLFLIGDDDRSRAWLQRRGKDLQALRAVGLVVNVATPEALAALRRLAPGLMLSPASGDELAQRLGLKHYPVLITATGIEPRRDVKHPPCPSPKPSKSCCGQRWSFTPSRSVRAPRFCAWWPRGRSR